jgi:hypothetical protein
MFLIQGCENHVDGDLGDLEIHARLTTDRGVVPAPMMVPMM